MCDSTKMILVRCVCVCVCLAACRGAAARAQGPWPECAPPAPRAACAAGEPYPADDGWFVRDYLVNGRRLSVSTSGRARALRWRCARGDDALHSATPTFLAEVTADTLELTDCRLPSGNLSHLLKSLNINKASIKDLTISFDTDKSINSNYHSGIKLTGLKLHYFTLNRLSVHRVSMSTEDFYFVTHVKELSLVENGLREVPDLSSFRRLKRLEIREVRLRDARRLASAPALEDLTLEAPDAAMVSLPRLRNATFLNVYMIGRIFGECGNLERLSVVGGQLGGVRAGWLAGCARLRRLALSRLPRLRALPPALLRDARRLTHLDLSHNALEALPTDLLQNIDNLKHLDLSFNRLYQALPENLLVSLQKYTCKYNILDLSHNELSLQYQIIDGEQCMVGATGHRGPTRRAR